MNLLMQNAQHGNLLGKATATGSLQLQSLLTADAARCLNMTRPE
jgi:hypothetical protein